MKLRLILLMLGLAGLVAAQAPRRRMMTPQMREERLSKALNLNGDQQRQVHQAFEDSDMQLQGLMDTARSLRSQLLAAVKADDLDQIDHVSRQLAEVHKTTTEIRADTWAKVYALLTPDQKTKFDNVWSRATHMESRARSGKS
jgi:Spy/CpxP family protein refolding chaperone